MADPRLITERQRILKRKASLWTERNAWDSHCDDIATYLLPRAARIGAASRNRNDSGAYHEIIDETATQAHGTLASGLMAGATSPARPWFRVATPDRDLMEFAPVKIWLDKIRTLMLAIFNQSNTYQAFHSTFEQIGAFGIGADVIVDHFDNVLHHYPQIFGRYAIGLDRWGKADTLCREIEKTVGQVVEEFGIANVSQVVKNLHDQGNLDAAVPVIHLIEPRRDRDLGKADSRNMRFASTYIEAGADGLTDGMLRVSGFKEFPVIAARWIVDGDDTYASRWPAAVALGSIKQLQQENLQKSRGIDFQVDPPVQAPKELRSAGVGMLPGEVTYYDSMQPGGGIKSLYEVQLDLRALREDIVDVRQRIDRSFFVDLFRMLANDQRSNITAREIAERHEEKLLILGPVIERLHNEMLKPAIDITFAKIVRAGLLHPDGALAIPRELEGQDLEVEFVSTLAQAQRAVGVQSIDRLVGTVASMSQIWPTAVDKLDADQVIDQYADALGVDPSLIVADDRVAIIRKDRAAQQQAAQMAAAAPAARDMATAAKTASEVDREGLTNLFSGYSIPGIAG